MYQATRAGFSGGVVVDYPNSAKAKKYYLCLFAGIQQGQAQVPAGVCAYLFSESLLKHDFFAYTLFRN